MRSSFVLAVVKGEENCSSLLGVVDNIFSQISARNVGNHRNKTEYTLCSGRGARSGRGGAYACMPKEA